MKLRNISATLTRLIRRTKPFSSGNYWSDRYAIGRNSGPGSYGRLATFKAKVLNEFVAAHHIDTVIEFGSGDGNQLALASYPHYIGYDVSKNAVNLCTTKFADDPTKAFHLVSDYDGRTAQLVLSLDVIFHLVEDAIFETYMRQLFASATNFVAIYSSNKDNPKSGMPAHVRHRKFTEWTDRNVSDDWDLIQIISNPYPYNGDDSSTSFADFYLFQKRGQHVL